ncbi:MAG: ribonuclease [Rhodoferax sp.]|jgi:ribonuclease T1|nr:ribonuclease [Rhodoferax sp.]MBK7549374.1 ribonuclease [Rhodoferax sp.]MBP6493834.1 ribonuclease [Rhodoferax sp.]MBP7573380.1 ribonuclease [Rhodoferax sp.]MBP8135141.1 ribonuclease [Rhodoferax sp.]
MVQTNGFKLVLTGLLLAAVSMTNLVQAKGPATADDVATVSVTELPVQGSQTYGLIRQGGPFPHEKDGVVFGNRERLLPPHQRGYYREYTVRTPGVSHRGTRRIVCGGQPKTPDACYYTADHYASFRRIVP